jgi:NAD dependent epimerase/dehydratase family enzyme
MLEVGALFLRTETELVLKSRRVVPGRLLQEHFSFTYGEWPQAARELCTRWRQERQAPRHAVPPRAPP